MAYKTVDELLEKEYKNLSDKAIDLFGKNKRLEPSEQKKYDDVKKKMSEKAKKENC